MSAPKKECKCSCQGDVDWEAMAKDLYLLVGMGRVVPWDFDVMAKEYWTDKVKPPTG